MERRFQKICENSLQAGERNADYLVFIEPGSYVIIDHYAEPGVVAIDKIPQSPEDYILYGCQ
jgi:predicted methyltransferase